MTSRGASEKYLIFGLGGEAYAVPLLALREVVADYEVTPLPALPPAYRGVITLRGSAVLLIDLRARVGLPGRPADCRRRVVVLDLEPQPVGLEVDEVLRVGKLAASDIEPLPQLPAGVETPFVVGMSRASDGKLVVHLDLVQVVGSLAPFALAEVRTALGAGEVDGGPGQGLQERT